MHESNFAMPWFVFLLFWHTSLVASRLFTLSFTLYFHFGYLGDQLKHAMWHTLDCLVMLLKFKGCF